MNLVKYLLLFATLLLSSSSFALPQTVHTIYFRTRAAEPLYYLETTLSAGYWQNGTCTIDRSTSSIEYDKANKNIDEPITGEDILFTLGPAYSCMEIELSTYDSNDKSTTQLVWDEDLFTYTASIPNGSNLSIDR